MSAKRKVGVLISGRGSNLKSLIEACADENYPAEIVLVISNVAGAGGLMHAANANIPTKLIPHKSFSSREAFDAVGGFDERYFAGEDAAFVNALKRCGRFAVPRPTVVTSGRKLRAYSAWRILGEAWRWMRGGKKAYQKREGLDIWYGERPADERCT